MSDRRVNSRHLPRIRTGRATSVATSAFAAQWQPTGRARRRAGRPNHVVLLLAPEILMIMGMSLRRIASCPARRRSGVRARACIAAFWIAPHTRNAQKIRARAPNLSPGHPPSKSYFWPPGQWVPGYSGVGSTAEIEATGSTRAPTCCSEPINPRFSPNSTAIWCDWPLRQRFRPPRTWYTSCAE